MKARSCGQVSRGFSREIARHLARLFDVPDGGGGYVGHCARGGFPWLHARGERSVFWRDWTSQTPICARGDAVTNWGRAASWSEARELAQVILMRRFRAAYATRYVEPILADSFACGIVRALPDDWHLSDEALNAWIWRFELRRFEAFGPTIWHQVQEDLSEKRARFAVHR